jgi:cation diffusion facilitator CzcD-associated flavoprotein CzcO
VTVAGGQGAPAPCSRDVVVVGGGQSGLAAGYFLRRRGLSFVILDAGTAPGGAWRHGWDSLRLFSPAQHSSLPGWPMPGWPMPGGGHPARDEVLAYLAAYEARYGLPVRRPVQVARVRRMADRLLVEAGDGAGWAARAVISATGTWSRPFIPPIAGDFAGRQIHSAAYRRPQDWAGLSVLVVGGGNSGAQILAEVSRHAARATWVTERPPAFLPEEVDGRVLFERATARWLAEREGRPAPPPQGGFGDIVMVPPVAEARARGALASLPPFARLEADAAVWPNGRRVAADAIIWCTGFRPALEHLAPLGLVQADGRIRVGPAGRAVEEKRLFLLGYGDWTGNASATLAGVTRAAREAVAAIPAD